MKSNHQSSTPVSPTSSNEEKSQRKVLLFAPDAKAGSILRRVVLEAGHFLTEPEHDAYSLIQEIARSNPHLLIVHLPRVKSSTNELEAEVTRLFPDLRICVFQGDLTKDMGTWNETLRDALRQSVQPESPRAYADGSRFILHDKTLQKYGKGKLNRPEKKEGWEKICSHQEARFVLQLQVARKNHQAAKKYYLCLLAQQSGLDQEIAYRLAHGSYKALSWSRELACKWLALLAHYLPNIELDHLPKAGTPGPKIDFVHHNTPVEGVYAASLVILFNAKPAVAEAIKQVVAARFEGHDDDKLFALSLNLYGMSKFLQQVGTAQIELMEAWLDPLIIERNDQAKVPRGERRNAGIYRDFYDLGFIINSPEPLSAILRGFHAGSTYVPPGRHLPSFAEFRRLTQTADCTPQDNQS